jgi:hypothetical protein
MSSIGSADNRNSQDEAIRRARETYQEKETDQAKAHSQEMKRMAEAHQTQIREMQQSHDSQMEDLKTKARDAISNRDMKYQKEIQDLRGMQKNQLRRQAEEADERIQKTEDHAKSSIERTSAIKDDQRSAVVQQYDAELKNIKKQFQETNEKSRTQMQTSAADQRTRLNQVHQKELKAVTSDRDRARDLSQKSYDSLRKNKDMALRDLEQAKKNETERLNSAYESNIREENAGHQESLDQVREGLQRGIAQNRARYEKELEKRSGDSKSSTEAFKGSINDRINSQLNAGKAENSHLKNEIVRQRTQLTQEKNTQVSNTRDSMQANIENLEMQRKDFVESVNEKNRGEIDGITKKSTETLNRSNRFFQDKLATERAMAENRHEGTKLGLEKRLMTAEMQADNRTEKLKAMKVRDEASLRTFFDKSSDAQRDNYENTLRELRDKNTRDQDAIFQNFSKQSAEREAKFQQKLTEVNNRFEGQIQDLKEGQTKQMADQIAIANKEKKQLVDQKNSEIQRQASQYETRLAKLEETHRREVDEINRHHEESLVSMTRSKGRS